MIQLTKAEEQIMQILWTLEKGTVQGILKEFDEENRPARTTVATVLNILETKNIVAHEANGRTNIYYPLVAKDEYSKGQLFGVLKNYFNGSFSAMASFFAKESNISLQEMDQIMEETRKALDINEDSDNLK